MKLNSTTAELHNFIYSRNLCIPSEVYDYGSHNSVQCTPVYSTTFIPPQSHDDDVAGWPVLIGISETLIRSKCTGIILFVYYVPVLSCPWLAYYKWPKASGESGGTWKHIEAHKDDLLDSICRAVPQTPFFFCPPRDAMLHCTFPPSLHLPGLSIIPSLCV